MRKLRAFFQKNGIQRLSSLDAYALWSAEYPPMAHNPLMEVEQHAMLAMLPDLHEKIVLDLACGSGRYAILAAEHGAGQVLALDNSLPMLQVGTIRHAVNASLDAIPLPDCCIDVVICALALGHLPEIQKPVQEMSRVLKPGCIALISDFHPFQYMKGARRTFSAGGERYEVEHYVHLYEAYHTAAEKAGMRIDAVAEPAIEGRGPVVLVLRFYKEL